MKNISTYKDAMDKTSQELVKEIEKFYPNTGDQVIEWRRKSAEKAIQLTLNTVHNNLIEDISEYLEIRGGHSIAEAIRKMRI